MKRAAVVIGVDRTGDLPTLSGAASGATDFADWCKSQQIDTRLLTDASNGKVTIKDVRDAIKNFADARSYVQLVVFFSGHGILKSPDEEYWLLSDAPADQYEAVNVVQSVAYARNTPFKHIVFISDACRTLPQTPRLSGVRGQAVFPNLGVLQVRPRIDQYFATAPADPAYEVSLEDALAFRGIFTRELLDGLKGADPSVPEQYHGSWFVTTRGLDPYLTTKVPAAAARVKATLRQIPEIRGESYLPLYMAELSSWTGAPQAGGGDGAPTAPPVDDAPGPLPDQVQLLASASKTGSKQPERKPVLRSAIDAIYNARGRIGFESGSGFSVIGADVSQAFADTGVCDLFFEDKTQQVRVRPLPTKSHSKLDEPASVLLQFGDGHGTLLAAWPGLIGTVLVEKGRVVNVNYTPARHTPEYSVYEFRADEIERRRAVVAAAARSGRFRLNPDLAATDAHYLRQLKKFDPTLGLYAAYAYAQVGAIDQIGDLLQYMQEDHRAVPFDVALLAKRLDKDVDRVPLCPMLTQGWAYLEPKGTQLRPAVRRAWEHLIPSLWTTFHELGVKELRSLFK